MNKLSWIIGAIVANTIVAATILPQQQSIDGAWNGSLTVGPQTLRITVRFTTGETGLRATIDIPQQGANGLQLKNVSYDDTRVYMELPAGPTLAVFDGRHVGDSIGGTFTQAGLSGTFFLKRSSQAAAMAEEPAEPLPYVEEEVTFHNAAITLAAIFGELDLQVPPAQNRGPLEQALRDGNHPDYTVRVLPRANHLFITATTGSPTEYATLEKVFVPEFLPWITEWILERVSR